MTGATRFSAADAALGYLYQIRCALLWALRKQKSEPDFFVSIETLDDVTFETSGADATVLLQTKHHKNATASLTDACPDLWKSLRVWFEGTATGQIPEHASLYLVTTGAAPDGSAASYLRATSRDVAKAQGALDATATTSTNEKNRAAYEAYLKARREQRAAILDRVTVIDAAPAVEDLNAALRTEVYWAAEREHHAAFLQRLEGWWFRRVLLQLTTNDTRGVSSAELEAQMSDLRGQFKQDALPVDEDLLDFALDDATRDAHRGNIFVVQIEIIKASKKRIANAIQDYYRAFTQRSRWLREDLVQGLELNKYERRLVEEWERTFEALCDELGEVAADEVKEQMGRKVLAWAEQVVIPIRPLVREPFLTRGSLHMLADRFSDEGEPRIGWHPEFRERLAALLRAKEGAA